MTEVNAAEDRQCPPDLFVHHPRVVISDPLSRPTVHLLPRFRVVKKRLESMLHVRSGWEAGAGSSPTNDAGSPALGDRRRGGDR